MTPRLALPLVATLCLTQVVGASPAAAAWTAAGSGSGRGLAVTLVAPATVSAACAVPVAATLTWGAVLHATGYVLARSSNGTSWTTVTTTSGTTASDTSLTSLLGLSLTWRVTATVGSAWQSPPSAASNPLAVTQLGACVPG
jgi:hypothetical protein